MKQWLIVLACAVIAVLVLTLMAYWLGWRPMNLSQPYLPTN